MADARTARRHPQTPDMPALGSSAPAARFRSERSVCGYSRLGHGGQPCIICLRPCDRCRGGIGSVELRTADVLDLPFPDGRFDVVCESVLAFVADKSQGLLSSAT